MGYYTTGISASRVNQADGGLTIRATTTHTDKLIQCYVSGELRHVLSPVDGVVEFELGRIRPTDIIYLLAVDAAYGQTDYWSTIWAGASATGNRIRVRTPQVPFQGLGLTWKVYLNDAGETSASRLVHHQPYYPGGRRMLGYGMSYGEEYGFGGTDCIGYGYCYGYCYGYDCEYLMWTSDPLEPGTYPVKVVVEDGAGNTTETTTTVTIASYARPASGLAVSTYTKGTDTLVLTWTESEDISA